MYKKVFTYGGERIEVEIGGVAKQSNASVLVKQNGTTVLSTVVLSDKPFFDYSGVPLIVDYRERGYAVGKIPGGFYKREGKPKEREIAISRNIDRAIRPLIPEDINRKLQINSLVLSCDGETNPDVLALFSSILAIMLSEVPIPQLLSPVKVSKVEDRFLINPTFSEQSYSKSTILLAGRPEEVVMIDLTADEASEEDVIESIKYSSDYISRACEFMDSIINEFNPTKLRISYDEEFKDEVEKILNGYDEKFSKLFNFKRKQERKAYINNISDDFLNKIKELNVDDEKLNFAMFVFNLKLKRVVRAKLLNEKVRPDGRSPDEIRPISCEIGILPHAHGSAMFTRGETQALATVTLGTFQDVQLMDGLVSEYKERFLFHYNFPGFATGEVKPDHSPSRREIGHGLLARKSLYPEIPSEKDFPYTIRIVSDILESNGSSSMASVCGGSLALYDAGVKLKRSVAGISIGLIKEKGESLLLTDILGLEDACGDMDFKVAGTAEGINSIQLDLKIPGIGIDIISDALLKARKARKTILEVMKETIPRPREEISPQAPKIKLINIPPSKIGEVIGSGGKNIRDIIEKTNTKIEIEEDGKIYISGSRKEDVEKASELVKLSTEEVVLGKTYNGRVTRIMDYGAIVEILPGKEGMLHISQVMNLRGLRNMKKFLSVGDKILVKVNEIEPSGRFSLSARYKPR